MEERAEQMEQIVVIITKKQWDAIKSLDEGDKRDLIFALCENAFDKKEPKFDEWRREEKMAIYKLMRD